MARLLNELKKLYEDRRSAQTGQRRERLLLQSFAIRHTRSNLITAVDSVDDEYKNTFDLVAFQMLSIGAAVSSTQFCIVLSSKESERLPKVQCKF